MMEAKSAEFFVVEVRDTCKRMLAKKADKSYAKVFKHDTIGISGVLALWHFAKP